MSGYLDRLLRRAQGEPTGLRPRQIGTFEPEPFPDSDVEAVVAYAPGAAPSSPAPVAASPDTPTPGGGVASAEEVANPQVPDHAGDPGRRHTTEARVQRVVAPHAEADSSAAPHRAGPAHPSDEAVPARATMPLASPEQPTSSATGSATADGPHRDPQPVTVARDAAPPVTSATEAPRSQSRSRRPGVPTRTAASHHEDTVIEVSIGRVEVVSARAAGPLSTTMPPRTPPAKQAQRPPIELSDYLKQRRSMR